MNRLITYSDYLLLYTTGNGYYEINDNNDITFRKERCENCVKINENKIFWYPYVMKNVKNINYLPPIYILKRDEIVQSTKIFKKNLYFKISLPNVNGNEMIITDNINDFVNFVKKTGDSIFLLEKYYPQQLLHNYKKIKYRFYVLNINGNILIYRINQTILSNMNATLKNELKQTYIIVDDTNYQYSFNKNFNEKTFKKVRNIIKELKNVFIEMVEKSNNRFTFFAVDFFYDVDLNIFLDNIQIVNDINFDKTIMNEMLSL